MTISETAVQPAAGSHPYPDPTVLPERFYPDITAMYERIGADAAANVARWFAQAHKNALDPEPEEAPGPLPRRRSHASAAVTRPDPVPAPQPLPLPQPVSGPELTGRQRRLFGRPKPAAPVRDQPPAVAEPAWQEPKRAGRHRAPEAPDSTGGTLAPPVAPEQDAPTLKPGDLSTEEVRRAIEAADEIQRQSASALERAGAKPADLAHLARPGDGRDAAEQVTAVIQRPADQGEQS